MKLKIVLIAFLLAFTCTLTFVKTSEATCGFYAGCDDFPHGNAVKAELAQRFCSKKDGCCNAPDEKKSCYNYSAPCVYTNLIYSSSTCQGGNCVKCDSTDSGDEWLEEGTN